MGWTGQYQKMPLGIDEIAEFFAQEFGMTIRKTELMSHGTPEKDVYMAVESKKDGHVFGLVILMEPFKDERGSGFRYKEMSEDMGPYYFEASRELIAMLSPTESASALKWRRSCLTGVSEFEVSRPQGKKEVRL